MNLPNTTRFARWAGSAGIFAAVCWITGDVLLVGHVADRSQFPLLFQTYATQIDANMAERLVGVPASRLIAGALCGVFSVWLYLAATWHLWLGIRTSRPLWAIPCVVLIFVGYALSPLPHAAFYYVGAVYQTLLTVNADAHAPLLTLAAQFHHVLLITWFPSVLCSMLGMFLLSLAIASGRSVWPRWMAITTNPIVVGAPIALMALSLPMQPWQAISAASYNVMWLAVYSQTVAAFGDGPSISSNKK